VNTPTGPDRILELSRAFRKAKVLFSAVELDVFTCFQKATSIWKH
jgi:hypothetical protein